MGKGVGDARKEKSDSVRQGRGRTLLEDVSPCCSIYVAIYMVINASILKGFALPITGTKGVARFTFVGFTAKFEQQCIASYHTMKFFFYVNRTLLDRRHCHTP